jgi:antitoxin CptB
MPLSRADRIKKILYRSSHRGCKETDFLFSRIGADAVAKLDDAALGLYETFLEESDYDIFAWLTGKERLPEEYAAIAGALAGSMDSYS